MTPDPWTIGEDESLEAVVGGGLVGHTFLSFIFDNALPLSISIETRPEVGESFNPVASLFKQFELIYVVGDERDLVACAPTFAKRLCIFIA